MLRPINKNPSSDPSASKSHLYNFLCALLSAGLLILAFPRTDLWLLAWIGLVPLLYVINGQRPFKAFQISFLSGFIFFLGVLYWLIHVTSVGVILLSAYCALYFGLFGLVFSISHKKTAWLRLWSLPGVWVVLEYLRGIFFSGFDWGSLGYSQYKNLIIIQIADLAGKFGVSFLIVMVNVFVYELIKKENPRAEKIKLAATVGLVLLASVGYGWYRFNQIQETQSTQSMVVGLVQGNIPQDIKWVEAFYPATIDKHTHLSLELLKQKPDLIIWPETSFPGYWNKENDYASDLKVFTKKVGTAFLFGTVAEEKEKYYNSAVLLSSLGESLERYDKIRLVPFGEYLPFRTQMPFLSNVVPIADFDAGKNFKVFGSLPQGRFSVLICFEDSFAALTRHFVKEGAQLLINLTNDAWFHDTKEAQMHLSASVLRAVENRRYVIRSANTGISCFINAKGEVIEQVKNEENKPTFIEGVASAKVYFLKDKTFYTQFGDVLVGLCLLLVVMVFV